VEYLIEDLSCNKEHVPSQAVWRKIWTADFPKITICATKHVDSKDAVRESLKKAFSVSQTLADKSHLKETRRVYSRGMRQERMYYWQARSTSALDPLHHFSMITDEGVSMLILDLVLSQLKSDDSNLMCSLVHNAQHVRIMVTVTVQCPFMVGFKPMGVVVTFGFMEYLVRSDAFKSLTVGRNPVGNTHEDIDGIFGNLRLFLMNKSWSSIEELRTDQGVLRGLKIHWDVLDVKACIQPVPDPYLSTRAMGIATSSGIVFNFYF
jgi:hypothetical protein